MTAGFGIWSQITKKPSAVLNTVDGTTLTTMLSMGAPMLIALGCISALMGFIGFCGTLKKKKLDALGRECQISKCSQIS